MIEHRVYHRVYAPHPHTTVYCVGLVISWITIFFAFWIYSITSYGIILGIGLGWVLAAIAASVLCWVWPVFPVFGALSGGWLLYGYYFV